MAPSKPYHLINYEKEYAQTGKVPKESAYRDHELRNRVQEKSDRIDDRLDALWNDVTSVSLRSDISIKTRRSPRNLGELFGGVAFDLLEERRDKGSLRVDIEFLLGILQGIDRVEVHDHTTVEQSTEYTECLLEELADKRKETIHQQAKKNHEWFEEYYIQRSAEKEDAKESIRRILAKNDIPQSRFIINRIHGRVDGMDTITEKAVLNNVDGLSLVSRDKLRRKIDKDISRLNTKRRGVQPKKVFEYISTEENQPVHTRDVVQSARGKDRSVVVTILNDLAGVEGRRKSGQNQVFSDAPVLDKVESERWTTTSYGEVLADWLFKNGLGLSNTTIDEELEVVEQINDITESDIY